MATDFVSRSTGELAFGRFWGGEADGVCFEFGTVSQFERVVEAARAGETFLPLGMVLDGDPVTAEDFERLVAEGRGTFGRFCLTLEVGSGELFRFTEED